MLGRWITRSPAGEDWLRRLGHRWAQEGHLSAAEWALAQVADHGSPTAACLYELGRVQSARGRLGSARDSLRRGLVLKPNFYLARKLLHDVCRDDYWRGAIPPDDEPTALRRAHLHLREALFPELVTELLRLDEELDHHAVDRLAQRLGRGPDTRDVRRIRERLDHSRALLEAIPADLAQATLQQGPVDKRPARLQTRDGRVFQVDGLHDGDDLIGYHLEVIIEDALRFLPLGTLRSVVFGPAGPWVDAAITLDDGSRLEGVVPLRYHGSERSALAEVRDGEGTLLSWVYGDLKLGMGKRIFNGLDGARGVWLTFGAPDLARMDFGD